MGLGGAINLTDSLIQKVHGGIGLGANVGFGGANFFKIKDLTTNFKDLFYLLQMGFDTHEDSTKSINDL